MSRAKLKRVARWLSEEENRDSLQLVLRETGYLLRHGRFRAIYGSLRFGLSDPYLMGKLLSLLSIFYPVYGKDLALYPEFEKDCFDGELHVRGYIRLWHVLVVLIRLLLNRQIRTLLLGGEKEDGKQQCDESD